MILAAILGMQAARPVLEFPDANAKFVSVQALVSLGNLTPKERSMAALLADTMAYDVDDYSRTLMRDTAAAAGEQVRVTLMPDMLRIQIGVVPQDLKYGIRFINNILRTSRLPEAELNHQIELASAKKRGLWQTALLPNGSDLKRVRRTDIVDFYHRICRPDNTTLVVGGNFKPGDAQEIWTGLTNGWTAEKTPRFLLEDGDPKTVIEFAGQENIISLNAQVIPGGDVAIAPKLLAIIALGCGKGSTLFEKVREDMGVSYRQEGLLWPAATGFVPRFIIATGDATPLVELAPKIRDNMLTAVDEWAEKDLLRALGMARAILERGVPMSPFYFNPWYPVSSSLTDQTLLQGYWQIKTGKKWDAKRLLELMALTPLDELKSIAKEMLEKASVSLIKASA